MTLPLFDTGTPGGCWYEVSLADRRYRFRREAGEVGEAELLLPAHGGRPAQWRRVTNAERFREIGAAPGAEAVQGLEGGR